MQKILIVEDDIDIQDILKNHLIDAGYEVAVASDGVAGIAMFDDTIDLVLLDIMLPKIDGYGVCEVIRKRSQVPIIMLTALSDEENQLRGFEQQIDDYIPKPFSPKILLCKIAAILRRRTAENQNQSLLTYKELSMDVDGFHVYQGGNEVVLTSKEFALLRLLFEAFYRADASRNRNTGGTGLGLYIVRKIMEMHHAKYGITNTSNGVMFWFELPCKQPIDNSI